MDSIVGAVATGLGDGVGFMASSGILFVVFAVLWVGFAVALVSSQGTIDAAWQSVRDLPWLVQVVVWILFLPVMAGLWIWETSWPLVLRLVLIIGLAGWNLMIMLPTKASPAV
jgi:hypothetical protein